MTKIRLPDGQWVSVAGTGEFVPSVSKYQSGMVTIPAVQGNATVTASVTFDTPMPDTDYVVSLSYGTGLGTINMTGWVTQQTVNGFLINLGRPIDDASQTNTVYWKAFKLMTDESRAVDEQAIAQNASDIVEVKAKIPSSASASNQLATKKDIPVTTQWIAANNAATYRKVDISLPSVSGVVQLTTKSGDVYFISKRDGTSIKFTKVVNGVGGDAVTVSGYSFDSAESVLTLYLTMEAWSSVRIDVLNAWSATGQNGASITVAVIGQSEMGGTAPTIVNVVTDTEQETSITLALTDSSADNMTLRLHKMGKMVVAEGIGIGVKAGTVKTNWAAIGTVPAGYRPKQFEFTTLQHNSSTIGVQFNTNGTVALYDYTGNNSMGYERAIHITYFTA